METTTTKVINIRRKEANKRYYEKHKEEIKEHNKEYAQDYKERRKELYRIKKDQQPKATQKKRGRPKKIKENE